MPLIVKTPENAAVMRATGPYVRALNVLDRKKTAVQRHLRRTGLAGYEPVTQATLLTVMEKAPAGSAFFDVGAHIGLYSAMVSAIFASRKHRVLAFEPAPETAHICRMVRRHNGLDYEVFEVAVSSEPGEATLHLSAKAETSNSLNPGFRESAGSVTVPVTTIDGIAREHGDPWLLKIDVETYEPMVLAGAVKTIEVAKPWIVCEILPSADHTLVRPALAQMAELNYQLYLIGDTLPWQTAEVDNYREFLQKGYRDWLMAPTALTDDFYQSLNGWLSAIAACDETTNQLTSGGRDLPRDWNLKYVLDRPRRWPNWLAMRRRRAHNLQP